MASRTILPGNVMCPRPQARSVSPASTPGRGRVTGMAGLQRAVGNRITGQLLAYELTHVVQQGVGPLRVQRQHHRGAAGARTGGAAPPCRVELCFAPIRRFGLGVIGATHAIINFQDSRGRPGHVEVDPSHHQAEAPFPGLHSHVVQGPGWHSGGTCSTITPVTCPQANAVARAARDYENLDVVYRAPPGPNSNSFGEWVLDRAGVSTSVITPHPGAFGWDYYITHPTERAHPPAVVRRADEMRCTRPIRPARTFRALIALVRDVETRLIACGVTKVEDRVHVLRGIYYGTIWSGDYSVERSPVRNLFFQQYTDSTEPSDPRSCLPCEIFLALLRSQDVSEGGRQVDVGHLMIALDARRSTAARRHVRLIEGVTGLEAATWAGDLGGAAARVALDRVSRPTTRAMNYFRLSKDYGAPSNLEGDIAGFAVAAGSITTGDAPALSMGAGTTIADALQAYFISSVATPGGWGSRCGLFLRALGAALTGATITNRAALVSSVAQRIHNFACAYLANFLRQRGWLTSTLLRDATTHLEGASREVAQIFIDSLDACLHHPSAGLVASGSGPAPSPRGSPSCTLIRVGSGIVGGAQPLLEEGERRGGELLERGGRELEEAGRAIEERRRDAERRLRELEQWWQRHSPF